MRFEWDPQKNKANIRDHRLDFQDAADVLEGPMPTAVDDRFDFREVRTVGIGLLRELVVVLVFVERDDDIIRIISFRKATHNEREKFYKFLKDRLEEAPDDVR